MKYLVKKTNLTFLAVLCISAMGFIDPIVVPTPPSMPEIDSITKDYCYLTFRRSTKDGGAPISYYRIYYHQKNHDDIKFYGAVPSNITPEHSPISCRIKNKNWNTPVAFRATAENDAGESDPSELSEYITFRD